MDASTAEARGIKRIRQACQNCRRKKTRCSGERPVCSFCARLGQQCRYDTGDDNRNGGPHPDTEELAARLATLEQRLMQMCDLGPGVTTTTSASADSTTIAVDNSSSETFCGSSSTPNFQPRAGSVVSTAGEWQPSEQSLPVRECRSCRPQSEPHDVSPMPSPVPLPVQLAAIDVYFEKCQNQPYCYFAEQQFRRQVRDSQVPQHLLFAVLATASRFAPEQGTNDGMIDGYARSSWSQILQRSLTNEDIPTVDLVQATNLLAVIDFTAGRLVQGWIKIGLAIRYAQELHMMTEPDLSSLPAEREERRRIFWSVYLLDRLASCGRDRPLVFRDEDLQVCLPGSEVAFRKGVSESSWTLSRILEGTHYADPGPDSFALTIMAASCLGRTARYMLQRRGDAHYPLWNAKSEYCSIASCLWTVETYMDLSGLSPVEYIRRRLTIDGIIDQQRCGHFLFGRALFHLSHIILNHPFLLNDRLRNLGRSAPPSFLEESSQRCRSHAEELTTMVDEARMSGCYVESSFYGYCILVAGTIHCLFSCRNGEHSERSASLLRSSFVFLKSLQRTWKHYPCLYEALVNILEIAKSGAQHTAAHDKTTWLDSTAADNALWWHALDYSSLCDCKTSASSSPASSYVAQETVPQTEPVGPMTQQHVASHPVSNEPTSHQHFASPHERVSTVNLDCYSFEDMHTSPIPATAPESSWNYVGNESDEVPWMSMPFETQYWQETNQPP